MLHELLFALSGHTGDIFVLNEDNAVSVCDLKHCKDRLWFGFILEIVVGYFTK